MRYFRLSYDTRQLSKKNIELINQTVIKKLGEEGFFVPEESQITLDFPIPEALHHEQNIFFSIPNNLCNEKKELFFRNSLLSRIDFI